MLKVDLNETLIVFTIVCNVIYLYQHHLQCTVYTLTNIRCLYNAVIQLNMYNIHYLECMLYTTAFILYTVQTYFIQCTNKRG